VNVTKSVVAATGFSTKDKHFTKWLRTCEKHTECQRFTCSQAVQCVAPICVWLL